MDAFVIKRPVITEKSLLLANTENTYVFEVAPHASKKQIQTVIEQLYQVKVVSVNTVSDHRSYKATGRRRLKMVQPKTKKALVKLVDGQTIALFDMTGETK